MIRKVDSLNCASCGVSRFYFIEDVHHILAEFERMREQRRQAFGVNLDVE